MHIELTKKEFRELAKLRAEIHRSGEVKSIKEMFTRSEAFGDRVAVVEKNQEAGCCLYRKRISRQGKTAGYSSL